MLLALWQMMLDLLAMALGSLADTGRSYGRESNLVQLITRTL